MLFKNLIVPKHLEHGVRPSKRGYRVDTFIIGGDSETDENGQPFSFQFFHSQGKEIIWTRPERATKDFINFCSRVCTNSRSQCCIYIHHLEFDLISFFYDNHKEFLNEEFSFKYNGWTVEGIFANVKFCRISKGHRTVWLLDTFTFFPGSLAKAAQLVCPDLPKLKTPKGLGKKKFTARDKGFVEYAMRDAEIGFHLGKAIADLHREYDIEQAVSAPHAAARIFRRQFLKSTLVPAPRPVMFAALRSYHGGKNGIYVKPGWYRGVNYLDLVSAYPWAMAQLPAFSTDKYKKYEFIKGSPRSAADVPAMGIYCVSGTARTCRWPILFDHAFKPIQGAFSNVWTTGPELREALRAREIKLSKCWGYVYDVGADKEPSPFKAYALHFFTKKDTATSPVFKKFFKLMLNSLYGKLIQKRRNNSGLLWDAQQRRLLSDPPEIVAGGLFHPFAASILTGMVRARIHELEHRYKAMHTATDGIFTLDRPRLKKRPGLGGLQIECRGTLALVRNKVYIFYDDEPLDKSAPFKSLTFPGKYIIKYALHGFHSTVTTLERLIVTGVRWYEWTKVNKLRESVRRGLYVNKFETRAAQLKLEVFNDDEGNHTASNTADRSGNGSVARARKLPKVQKSLKNHPGRYRRGRKSEHAAAGTGVR